MTSCNTNGHTPRGVVEVRRCGLLATAVVLVVAPLVTAAPRAAGQRPELALQVGHVDAVGCLAVSPDGRYFASGSSDQTVKVWDTETGMCLWTLSGHGDPIDHLAFSPDGRHLVSGSSSGGSVDVRLWEVASGRQVVGARGERDLGLASEPNALPFSTDGQRLAIPFRDRVALVSLSDRRAVDVPGPVFRAAWSGDGRRLAVLAGQGASILDAASRRRVANVPVDGASTSAIALDREGRRLACANGTGSLVLKDVKSARPLWSASLPNSLVRAVAIREDRDLVVVLSESAALAWDLATGHARYTIDLAPNETDAVVSPDWRSLALVTRRGEQNRSATAFPRGDEISIWNLDSGSLERTIESGSTVGAFALGGPGRRLVAEEFAEDLRGGAFASWDLVTGEHRRLPAGRMSSAEVVAWSPDGRWIATGGATRIWDPRSGAPFALRSAMDGSLDIEWSSFAGPASYTIDSRPLPEPIGVVTHKATLTIHLQPGDDKGSEPKGTLIPVDPDTLTAGTFGPDASILAAGDGTGAVRLWDIRTGALLRTLGGLGSEVRSLAFDPAGACVAAAGRDGPIVVWDVASGSEVVRLDSSAAAHTIRFTGSSEGTVLHAVTADGWLRSWREGAWNEPRSTRIGVGVSFAKRRFDQPQVVAVTVDGRALLVDLATGTIARELRLESGQLRHFMFVGSADAPFDGVRFTGDRVTTAWDLRTGRSATVPTPVERLAEPMAFRPDGRRFVAGMEVFESEGWRATFLRGSGFGRASMVIDGQRYIQRLHSVAYSPDGGTLATGTFTLNLLSGETGRMLHRIEIGRREAVDALAFAPDGKTLVCASHAGRLALASGRTRFERQALRVVRLGETPALEELAEPEVMVTALAFAPDGRLVAGDLWGTLSVWDVAAKRVVRKAVVPTAAPINAVSVSPDGRTLVASSGSLVTVWELPSLRLVRTLAGHAATVGGVALGPDGRHVLSGSLDGTARLWDVSTGEHLATIVSLLDRDEWLVVTPDGLFDGSPDQWSQIRWRFGAEAQLLPVEAFFADFYTPGLLADLLAGNRPRARRDISALDRRQPSVSVRIAAPAAGASTVDVEIDVAEAPADATHRSGSGARDVRLFRNGALVRAWRGDVLAGAGRVRLRATIPAVEGENALAAYAFNRDNVKSADARAAFTGAETLARPPTAHVVVVGVSKYENTAFNLRFAAADARAFAERTRARLLETGAFARVDVVELLDERATRAGILEALGRLSSAHPEDAVFVFFAGHGLARGDRFLLVPHDLGYGGPSDGLDEAALDRLAVRAISDRDLEEAFERVDARHFLLVVDACFAGRVLGEAGAGTGPLNARGLAQLAYEKGMHVLAAAGRDQQAVESASLGHGVLTYALVDEGLEKRAADAGPADGLLLLDEWLEYAAQRVPAVHDRLAREGAGREITHGSEDEARLQTPRLYRRSRVDRRPLVVASYGPE